LRFTMLTAWAADRENINLKALFDFDYCKQYSEYRRIKRFLPF
jgi:hypothetical protein